MIATGSGWNLLRAGLRSKFSDLLCFTPCSSPDGAMQLIRWLCSKLWRVQFDWRVLAYLQLVFTWLRAWSAQDSRLCNAVLLFQFRCEIGNPHICLKRNNTKATMSRTALTALQQCYVGLSGTRRQWRPCDSLEKQILWSTQRSIFNLSLLLRSWCAAILRSWWFYVPYLRSFYVPILRWQFYVRSWCAAILRAITFAVRRNEISETTVNPPRNSRVC